MMKLTVEGMQDDSDWQQAWGFGDGSGYNAGGCCATKCEGAKCSEGPVGVASLAEVIAESEGENEERTWVAIARLIDGRFAFVEAGCDYTGWDCQAGGAVWVSDCIDNLWQFGVTEEARVRLGAQFIEWKRKANK